MPAVVETTRGTLRGVERDGIVRFRRVRYAEPPVGALRWRAPRPARPWTGARDAAEPPPAPPQPRSPMEAVTAERRLTTDEDCLYLTATTPGCDAGRRPVLVWIHGGGLLFGWGADAAYDGAGLARRGAVVVSVGYRLGALGFLAHPALAGDDGVCSNFGLLDQVAALEWVRDEIAAFGGDPDNVTVFGESAGGMSVGALLATPRARGLFRRAISQSGGARASSFERAVGFAERLARELGLPDVDRERLLEVPADKLVEAQQQAGVFAQLMRGGGFSVDGEVLPAPPLESIRGGTSRGVSLLAGTNRDEAKLGIGLLRGRLPEVDDAEVERRTLRWLREAGRADDARAKQVVETFRAARAARGQPVTPVELLFAIETELRYRRLCLELLEAHLAHSPQTYTYLFSWASKALDGAMGSAHGLDIPFVFGSFGGERFTGPIDAADRALSARMQDAWVSFARSGRPADGWPRYDTHARATQVLDLECAVEHAPYEPERTTWEA